LKSSSKKQEYCDTIKKLLKNTIESSDADKVEVEEREKEREKERQLSLYMSKSPSKEEIQLLKNSEEILKLEQRLKYEYLKREEEKDIIRQIEELLSKKQLLINKLPEYLEDTRKVELTYMKDIYELVQKYKNKYMSIPVIDEYEYEIEEEKEEKYSPNIEVDIPKVDIPKVDIPKVDIPKVDIPKVDIPKVDIPKVDIPKKVDYKEETDYIQKVIKNIKKLKETTRIEETINKLDDKILLCIGLAV